MVLLYALVRSGGVELYAHSLHAFAQDLPSLGAAQAFTIAIGVGLLVCTGADYHQFVLAARGPGAADHECAFHGGSPGENKDAAMTGAPWTPVVCRGLRS